MMKDRKAWDLLREGLSARATHQPPDVRPPDSLTHAVTNFSSQLRPAHLPQLGSGWAGLPKKPLTPLINLSVNCDTRGFITDRKLR